MKTKVIALLAVMVGLAVGVASAQSTQPLTFKTPVPFVVGDQLMPAGEYTVRDVSISMTSGFLSFRSADGDGIVVVRSIPIEKLDYETRHKLIFHRYGSQYYVSEIWTPGYRTGRIIMQHPSELKLAKNAEPQHVTLYLGAAGR
jgi:hypothetical protein